MPVAHIYFGNQRSPICTLYRALTRSPWSHVAIGDGDVVDDWSFGRLYVEQDKYEARWPFVDIVLEVAVPLPIQIASLPKDPNKSHLKAILAGTDCVGRVKAILSTGGLVVPVRILTPNALFDWLMNQGGVCRAPGEDHRLYPVRGAGVDGEGAD